MVEQGVDPCSSPEGIQEWGSLFELRKVPAKDLGMPLALNLQAIPTL